MANIAEQARQEAKEWLAAKLERDNTFIPAGLPPLRPHPNGTVEAELQERDAYFINFCGDNPDLYPGFVWYHVPDAL